MREGMWESRIFEYGNGEMRDKSILIDGVWELKEKLREWEGRKWKRVRWKWKRKKVVEKMKKSDYKAGRRKAKVFWLREIGRKHKKSIKEKWERLVDVNRAKRSFEKENEGVGKSCQKENGK